MLPKICKNIIKQCKKNITVQRLCLENYTKKITCKFFIYFCKILINFLVILQYFNYLKTSVIEGAIYYNF